MLQRFHRLLRDSVRGRLTLLVLAITVPVSLLVLGLIFQAYRNERTSIAKQAVATAKAISAVVDHNLGEDVAFLRGLAASPALRAGDLAGFGQQLRAVSLRPGQWLVLAAPDGRQLVNTRAPADVGLPSAGMPDEPGAYADGAPYFSNVTRGQYTGVQLVHVSLPIVQSGERKYILTLAMLPSELAQTLAVHRFSPDTVIAITDRTGRIVARHPNGEKYTGAPARPEIIAALAKPEATAVASVTLEGIPVIAAVARSPVTGWGVALGVPEAVLNASARRLLWVGLASAAVLMAVAVGMAAWIGRGVIHGVEQLKTHTEAIGRGTIAEDVSTGLAETDFVARTLRTTAEQRRARERENAALTAALHAELENQKRAEEASRQLATIVETSDDAIFSHDLDGVILSWNRGAERIYGYTAAETIGRPTTLLVPPERLDEETLILARARAGGSVEHFETVRRRKDGTGVSLSLTVSPLFDRHGVITGASKIARDITEQKRAAARQHALVQLLVAVNRAEALSGIYEAALTAMCRIEETERAAILLLDENGVMRFKADRGLSEAYRRAVDGHSPWSADATNPQTLWIEDVAKAELAPGLQAALEREGIRAVGFVPLLSHQRLIGKFMIYHATPRAATPGDLRQIEAVANQVALAIHRQTGAQALEALVNERTASLRQAVAQMQEFSYTVSHDLRAPVRAMRGYAEAVLQDHGQQLDPAGRELLERILRNGSRMERLIQDLLTYTRISQRDITLEPVSMNRLLQEIVQHYPDMRPERADIVVPESLPDVIGHEPSLAQVVSNLLSNAIKFVPPSARPRVQIGWERRAEHVRLWFEDNGIGIKPELQSRLFRMFERVHPEKPYEGTGVGLAIVRKAIERMNGTVGVESDGRTGSRFWFELPFARPGEPDTPTPAVG